MTELQPAATALILIDLQEGIVALPVAPRTGAAVVTAATSLAGRFRKAGAPVFLVNVDFSRDVDGAPKPPVDRPMRAPADDSPDGWARLVDGLAQPSDLRITKHQWNAFHGTDLDPQLRRRGIKSVVIAGIATNIGVESTARAADEHGYTVVVAEDGCASFTADMHAFACDQIFPLLGRVVQVDDLVFRA